MNGVHDFKPLGKEDLEPLAGQIAVQYGIPDHVFKGLIDHESSWNPYAKNPKSTARGLGQHLDRTLRDMGYEPTGGPDDPRHNPELSLKLAAQHLVDKYNQTGDWRSAVKSYGENTEAYMHRVSFNIGKYYRQQEQPGIMNRVAQGIGDFLGPTPAYAGEGREHDFIPLKEGVEKEFVPLKPETTSEAPNQTKPQRGESIKSITAQQEKTGEQLPIFNTDPAPFHVLANAATVDKPETKFKIFAKNRFPHLSPEEGAKLYFQKGGDIYYLDPSGKARKEVGEGVLEKLKQVSADILGHWPEIAGGFALQGLFPGGLEAGAVGGGAIRRGINQLAGVESYSPSEYATGAGKDLATAVAGRVVGTGISKGIEKIGQYATGDQIARLVNRDVGRGVIDMAEASRLAFAGKQYGIDLTVPEITNSPTLVSLWANLAKNPKWPHANQKIAEFFRQVRNPQIQQAINNELGHISPAGRSIYEAGMESQQVGKGIVKRLEGSREAASEPLYRDAFSKSPAVDVNPVISKIDDLLLGEPQGSSGRGALDKIRKMLSTPEGEPETSLRIFHNTKIEIDRMLDAAKQDKSISNLMRRNLMDVKTSLLEAMEAASPDYAMARQTFERLSKPITDLRYGSPDLMPRDIKVKTIMQRLIDLPPEQLGQVPKIVFDSNPYAISQTKKWFIKNGYEDSWNALIRAHLETKIGNINDTILNSEGGNLGYAFKRQILGKFRDEEKLRAAMNPQQFNRFMGFMEVLEQTSKIIYTNSQTAMQQEASKIVENMSGGWLARTASKISINPKTWFKNLIEFRSPQNASKLAEAFVNPDYFSTINQLMKMPNTVDRAIKVSAFIGGLVGREELIPGEDVPLSSEKKVK